MEKLEQFGIKLNEKRYAEEILYTMALLYNVVSGEIADYLSNYGLSIGKLNILLVIKNQGVDKGIAQVDISKHLIVTPSNMTKMIDKLEQDRLLNRLDKPGDRRVKLIKMTPKANKLLDKLWPEYQRILDDSVKSLNTKEKRDLSRLLRTWFEKIG